MKKLKQYESKAITIGDILNLVEDIPNWESYIMYMSNYADMDEEIESDFKSSKYITSDDLKLVCLDVGLSIEAYEVIGLEYGTKLVELAKLPKGSNIQYDYEDGFIYRNFIRVTVYDGFIYLD